MPPVLILINTDWLMNRMLRGSCFAGVRPLKRRYYGKQAQRYRLFSQY
jgi:hypothetical protein